MSTWPVQLESVSASSFPKSLGTGSPFSFTKDDYQGNAKYVVEGYHLGQLDLSHTTLAAQNSLNKGKG